MSWLTTFRRFWWLLPIGTGLIGLLVVMRVTKPSPQPTPIPKQTRLKPKATRHVRGIVSSPLGSEEHIVAVGDFNADGQQDLAVTNGDPDTGLGVNTDPQGAVTLWLGDGYGGLRHGPVLQDIEATLLASFDADGDGDTDLLAGSCCDDSLLLWRNEGQGKLVPQAIPCEWGVDDLATGDIDGDGDIDLIIPRGWQLTFGLNDGQGHFRWQSQGFRQKPIENSDLFERLALADVDGDHDLDIVSSQNQGSILFNDGQGHFGDEQRLHGCTGYSLAIGDLNGDARPDLVMDISEGRLGLYLNDGTGHFGEPDLSQMFRQPQSRTSTSCWVALGDVDHDDDLDVVFNFGEEVWVRLNDSHAQFDPAYRVLTRPSALEELSLADLDHDGWLDILSPIPVTPARGRKPTRAALTSLRPPTDTSYYQEVDQMPTALGGGAVQPVVEAAMQQQLVLPPGYSISPARPPYNVTFIIGQDGRVEQPELGWQKITPRVDSVMLQTLHQLRFAPGRLHGRPVRVALDFKPQLSGQGPPQADPTIGEETVYTHVAQLPTFADGTAILPRLRTQGLNQLIVSDGTQVPPHSRLVVKLVIGKDGKLQKYQVVERISPEVDGILTSAFSDLPPIRPGRLHGRSVPVALTLTVEPTGANAPLTQSEAEHLEARTRRQGIVRRRPGQTDATFLRRALPLSLAANNGRFISYAWRPGAFGKQLFVAVRGKGDNEYGTDLLVLDPYHPTIYALRVLTLESLGDLTNLESLFFADVDHDGRSELLALKECSLRETLMTDKHGRGMTGHAAHYATDVFRLAGADRAGRPRYQLDTTARPYLDELPTAADVRQALARHRRPLAAKAIK